MKKLVKVVLPIAFIASTGLGLIACEEKKATPPAKQTPPAGGGEKKEADKK
mgnify:CR=1 FL=1